MLPMITLPRRGCYKPSHFALTPVNGVTGQWLDDLILAGRLVVGLPAQHEMICTEIRSERKHLPSNI